MKFPALSSSVVWFVFIIISVIAGALLFSIVNAGSPSQASTLTLWAVFGSFTLVLTAGISLLWHMLRLLWSKRGLHVPKFLTSVRQSFLFSLLLTLSLFLNSLNLFQVWDALPLVIALILVEFFFQAEKRPHASLSYEK